MPPVHNPTTQSEAGWEQRPANERRGRGRQGPMGGEGGRAAASCPVKSWLVYGQKAEAAVTCNIVANLFLVFFNTLTHGRFSDPYFKVL